MTTVFCVRPRGFNIGNDTIFLGVRHLLRRAFDSPLNIVQVAAAHGEPGNPLRGLSAASLHQMNLYGHGVVVGGGNLYENSGLEVDVDALAALRLPLMLFSLSHGRIYDHRRRLWPRTDAMPGAVVAALNDRAAISVARDDATLHYLRGLGVAHAEMGGCPSLLLSDLEPSPAAVPARAGGTLVSIRNPELANVPLAAAARLGGDVRRLVDALERDGFGPMRILCHDLRDLPFAASLGGLDYLLPDDVHHYLALLRSARLVVTFRLHAFLPCLSFGTPAINISYDERSSSLVRTIGFEAWDVDLVHAEDLVADVRDRCGRLDDYEALRQEARPRWEALTSVMHGAMARFAYLVRAYESERPDA